MAKSKLGAVEPVKVRGQFRCAYCGSVYSMQTRNFPTAQSSLYKGNNGYLCWCNKCIDILYLKYREEGLTEPEAARKLCSKFDIYWSEKVWSGLTPGTRGTSGSMIRTYLNRMNLTHYSKKTYDNTLAEEEKEQAILDKQISTSITMEEDSDIPDSLIEFWGRGRDPWSYADLQRRYDELTKGYSVDSPATATLVKQACLSAYEIDELQKSGKPFEKQQASLVNILGSLNLKPSQIKEDERNSGLDNMPFGVAIQKWEQTRPIPEPDEDWVDVDNIKKYNMTWFLGTLCDMVGVDNQYSNLYQDAMSEFKVDRPDYSDDEDVSNE